MYFAYIHIKISENYDKNIKLTLIHHKKTVNIAIQNVKFLDQSIYSHNWRNANNISWVLSSYHAWKGKHNQNTLEKSTITTPTTQQTISSIARTTVDCNTGMLLTIITARAGVAPNSS